MGINKGVLIQYFFIGSIYVWMFIAMFIMRQVEYLISIGQEVQAANIKNRLTVWCFAYFLISAFMMLIELEYQRAIACSLSRMCFSIMDVDEVLEYESMGVVENPQILISQFEVDDCFSDPEISRMLQEIENRDSRLKRDPKTGKKSQFMEIVAEDTIKENSRTGKRIIGKKDENMVLYQNSDLILNEDQVKFEAYDIEQFMIQDFNDFFSEDVITFLGSKSKNLVKKIDSKKLFLSLTHSDLLQITSEYKILVKKRIDELEQQLISINAEFDMKVKSVDALYEKVKQIKNNNSLDDDKKQQEIDKLQEKIHKSMTDGLTSEMKNRKIEEIREKIKNIKDVDFIKKQKMVKNNYDLFFMEEIDFLKDMGYKNWQTIRRSNLPLLEKQLNTYFEHSKNRLGKGLRLEERVKETTLEIIKNESKALFNLSSDSRLKHIRINTARMQALFYEYKTYLVYWDQDIELCVDIIDAKSLGKKDEKADRKYVKTNIALLILPVEWEKCFDFKKKRISYNGHNFKVPKVTTCSFVFVTMLTHDIAVLFCTNSDYTQKHTQQQLIIDPNKVHEAKINAYKELLNNLGAKQTRLKTKIGKQKSDIREFRRERQDRFIQNLANYDRSKPQVDFGMPKNISVGLIVLLVVSCVMCFFGGLLLGMRNEQSVETTSSSLAILLSLIGGG